MGNSYKIYCKANEESSEFTLVAEKDGEIVDTQTEYCFEDVMIECYKFLNRVVEKYWPNTRFDSLEVNLNHKFF